MAIRPIVLYPDPVLLRPTRPVEDVDDEVRDLVGDLVETMYAAPGIGLAANQLGASQRVCVVDLSAGEQPDALVVFVNPRVTEVDGDQSGEEGCLSFPGITGLITRPEMIEVRYTSLEGETVTEEADGLLGTTTKMKMTLSLTL